MWHMPTIPELRRWRQRSRNHPLLTIKFETNLGYMKPCFKQNQRKDDKYDDHSDPKVYTTVLGWRGGKHTFNPSTQEAEAGESL